MKYSFLLLFLFGCASDPASVPFLAPKVASVPVIPPSANNPGFYQGYAVASQFNSATHSFQRAAADSTNAQIRVVEADNEIKATISINSEDRPYDVFLFLHNGYYIGNDSISYAYFSADYNTIVWGRKSPDDGNIYKTVYATR